MPFNNRKGLHMTDASTHNFQKGQERLVSDLRTVVDDAEALLRQAVDGAGQGYGDARAKLEGSLERARRELATLEKAVINSLHETDRYVRKHPWESVGVGAGIGAGVGLLLGLLIARK
jgi:ElaB/YqjD/DUF883 family membrane-anchored ribosome-binding protein